MKARLLGLLLSQLIALPCIWIGQRSVNSQAQLLLVPSVFHHFIK